MNRFLINNNSKHSVALSFLPCQSAGRFLQLIVTGLLLSVLPACKKFVEVPPPSTELTGAAVFTNNANAQAVMSGIYYTMVSTSFGGGPTGPSIITGLSADEVGLAPGAVSYLSQEYINAQLSTNPTTNIWFDSYKLIYQANAAIAGVPASTGMTTPLKNQFLGEALFIRAYCYFYLVNLYGDVPLITSINYQDNARLSRTPKAQVYQLIIADLKQAEGLLGDPYVDGSGASSTERVRPNKEAAAALLARTYLYTGDWNNAVKESTQVISSGLYTLNPSLNQVFLATSQEAVWQLELNAKIRSNTADGLAFLIGLLRGPSAGNPVYMSNGLAGSFEPGDLRRNDWVDSLRFGGATYYYPYKYKVFSNAPPPTEFPMMLRYAEQFLIRAEANVHLGQSAQAITDLNMIRSRAGLSGYAGATDSTSTLNAIMHERQVELFTEGHRWFDLQRTGRINSVMGPPGNACQAKGGTWVSTAQLFPIPESEILLDNNLAQNPGYQ